MWEQRTVNAERHRRVQQIIRKVGLRSYGCVNMVRPKDMKPIQNSERRQEKKLLFGLDIVLEEHLSRLSHKNKIAKSNNGVCEYVIGCTS